MIRRTLSRSLLVAGTLSALAGTAIAGSASITGFTDIGPSPIGLPSCNTTEVFDACRLPVKQGTFDTLNGWVANGHVQQGGDATGNRYATIGGGASVKQAVYTEYGTPTKDASYVLRFRVMSENGDAPIRATLSMSDYNGAHTDKLGATTTMARHHEWTQVELVVDGKAFVAPAHVMIEIGNESPNAIVQLDDVFLVQSADTETAG